MISFRFHVVSITAVFLAIAIGVVVGTTYVDGAVVDGLRTRIGSVSDNLDVLREQNDRLDRELSSARSYIASSADYAVSDRLVDAPVLLVAIRGIDETAVENLARLLRRAGATMPGIVWIDERAALANDDDRAALASLLDARTSAGDDALWTTAWAAAVQELGEGPPASPTESTTTESTTTESTTTAPTTTTTTAVAPVESSVVDGLLAEGLVSFDPVGDEASSLTDLVGTSPRLVVVTGTRALGELAYLLPIVVGAAVDGDLPAVVAEVHVEAPEATPRASLVKDLLDDATRDAVILVDHAERAEGQVATVLAVHDVVDGGGLHYGYGDGADGVLPSWTPP